MTDFLVTMKAGNIVFGEMVFVNKRDIIVTGQFLRLIVASKTTILQGIALTPNHIQMTILTGNPLLRYKIFMIVGHISNLERLCRKIVATQTTT